MAEPISTATDSDVKQPANAEDRKAAAALDALNPNAMSQENGETQDTKQPTASDQAALKKAMGRLEAVTGSATNTSSQRPEQKKDSVKKEAEVKKKVKLSAEDVQFLVNELDLSKVKATELLRAHDGKLESAVEAFVVPATSA